jgi:hypothetical protein
MDNEELGRNGNGTFGAGNRFGKGRPPRPIERQYLAALSDAVTLDDWQAVCRRALEDAKAGDAKARDWLARYVLGEHPMKLLHLAAAESAGDTPETDIAKRRSHDALFANL